MSSVIATVFEYVPMESGSDSGPENRRCPIGNFMHLSGVWLSLGRNPQMSNKRKTPMGPRDCKGDEDEDKETCWNGGDHSSARSTTSPDHTCVICMEVCGTLDDQECCRLPCLHSFHSVCIHPWLLTSATCPICREAAPTCHRGTIDSHSHQVMAEMFRVVQSSNVTLQKELQEARDHILSLEMLVADAGPVHILFNL